MRKSYYFFTSLFTAILIWACSKSGDDPADTPEAFTTYKYPVTVPDVPSATVRGYKDGNIVDTKTTDPVTFKTELIYKVLNTSSQAPSTTAKGASAGKEAGEGELDSIVATKFGYERTVFKNVQPGVPLTLPLVEEVTGESANFGVQLVRGGPYVAGALVTLTKSNDPNYIYTVNSTSESPSQLAYFENVFTPSAEGNSTFYEVKVTSLLGDPEFPEQRQTISVPRGTTTFVDFDIEDFEDKHYVSVRARDYLSRSNIEGAIIKKYDAQTNDVVETKTTDINGYANFILDEGEDVYFSNKYANNYEVTNGVYESPDDIQKASDVADTLNVISFPIREYLPVSGMAPNTDIPAEKINLYKPVAINTPQIRGEEYLGVPADTPGRDELIAETDLFKNSMGIFGTTYTTETYPQYAVGDPLYDNYTAKYGEANTFPGQIGTNVLDGTSTLIDTKLDDDVVITIYAKELRYRAANIPVLHKEVGTSSGFPEISQNTTGWPTSRDPGSPVSAFDSPGDLPIMNFWNDASREFYVNGDINGPYVYRPVTRFDD